MVDQASRSMDLLPWTGTYPVPLVASSSPSLACPSLPPPLVLPSSSGPSNLRSAIAARSSMPSSSLPTGRRNTTRAAIPPSSTPPWPFPHLHRHLHSPPWPVEVSIAARRNCHCCPSELPLPSPLSPSPLPITAITSPVLLHRQPDHLLPPSHHQLLPVAFPRKPASPPPNPPLVPPLSSATIQDPSHRRLHLASQPISSSNHRCHLSGAAPSPSRPFPPSFPSPVAADRLPKKTNKSTTQSTIGATLKLRYGPRYFPSLPPPPSMLANNPDLP